ncbi:MAG TPA: bile acid:sodium symporter family protein [Terriglobia bacterium]|nr:bile acid:sodium symporter family protein [Terriglobia bacterium]
MKRSLLQRLRVDPYILAIVMMVVLASILPCRGQAAVVMNGVTYAAISLLFFLYGARLPVETIIQGLTNWRLQVTVLLSTFLLFPLLGLAFSHLFQGLLGPSLSLGLLFLCLLPSTVQSSIAFTSIARGNVAAALCSASISNLLGIFISPLLVALLLARHDAGISASSIKDIVLQLLVPFLAGQILRPWLKGFVGKHKFLLGLVDRGSILLVVYTAFSEGVVNGIWSQIDIQSLLLLLVANLILLTVVLVLTTIISRRMGFSKEDEIAIVFCGSKKSLASGIPIANVLFPAQTVGLMVLPLMLFHQVQLMACAAIARRYARRPVQETH